MKRLCIKSLPPVLCIQLKRFDYDWELNRAIKFDDYFKVSSLVVSMAFMFISFTLYQLDGEHIQRLLLQCLNLAAGLIY